MQNIATDFAKLLHICFFLIVHNMQNIFSASAYSFYDFPYTLRNPISVFHFPAISVFSLSLLSLRFARYFAVSSFFSHT